MANSDHPSGPSAHSPDPASDSPLAGAAKSTASTVSAQTRQAGERVREEGSRIAGEAQKQARAFLAEQKEVAARHIGDIAGVLHETVDQLRQRSPGAVSDYAERAAQGLDSFAAALRDQDVQSLIGSVQDFARRQPALFMAGSVALGFGLARFLKSSSAAGNGQGARARQYASSQQSGMPEYASAEHGSEYRRHIGAGMPGSGEAGQVQAGSQPASPRGSESSPLRSASPSDSTSSMGGDGPGAQPYGANRS